MSIDGNGAVKALVGGQNYKTSTVDLALGTAGGGSGRQAGSTFKAFMLADLIKAGYSVESVFPAPPEVVFPHGNTGGTPWRSPTSRTRPCRPHLSLIDATALSVNTVYAQVVDALGAANLDHMAEALGIKSSELHGVLLRGARDGRRVTAGDGCRLRHVRQSGRLSRPVAHHPGDHRRRDALPLPVQPQTRVVLSSDQATVLNYVLQQVVLRGTGAAAGDVGTPVAGKTGTTENSTDGWFIGYTPHLTTAVWMGYASSRSHGRLPWHHQPEGGTIPAELWHDYMTAALASDPQYAGAFPPVYYLTA